MNILIKTIEFLKEKKKWWLLPIIFFSMLFVSIKIISEGLSVIPLVYTLF
jgi:hypothetical protein